MKKILILAALLAFTGGIRAQKSNYFIYDRIVMDSVMEQVTETSAQPVPFLEGDQTSMRQLQTSGFLCFILGVFSGCLLPAGGQYLGSQLGHPTIGFIIGGVVGVVLPSVLILSQTKDEEMMAFTGLGGLAGILLSKGIEKLGGEFGGGCQLWSGGF